MAVSSSEKWMTLSLERSRHVLSVRKHVSLYAWVSCKSIRRTLAI